MLTHQPRDSGSKSASAMAGLRARRPRGRLSRDRRGGASIRRLGSCLFMAAHPLIFRFVDLAGPQPEFPGGPGPDGHVFAILLLIPAGTAGGPDRSLNGFLHILIELALHFRLQRSEEH